ncbi:hypothetical protein CRD36_00930 [Paremcibacter congregatus]|uniref:Uncharacterized protein n=1 Tax=Paremcibacter congregatus TaxID=2043170 RepID=A0A2G4YW44_9PROT|nr:hypothetical protein CRD36_00930 [Paremcibacter congregatus]
MTVTDLSNMDMEKFGCLDQARRIWAVAAIHGETGALATLHEDLLTRFRPGDQLVYLGNYFGNRPTVVATLNELLETRRKLMALGGTSKPEAFVYLRGAREEMLTKLLELQFAPNPGEVMDWLVDHNIGAVVASYGTPEHVARAISREGTLSISRWTSSLRRAIHNHPGHSVFLSNLRRAGFSRDGKMLFVHASIDVNRPVTMQKDNFWWDNGRFDQITSPYSGFARIVRGYDHSNKGLRLNSPHTATLDGGCGRGGALNAVCFTPDGDVADHISVQTEAG